jgi:flagellar protein FlaJ
MNINTTINEIACGLFGTYFTRRRAKFSSLSENLLKARIYAPVEKWLSKAIFYSIIGVILALFIYFFLKVVLSFMLKFEFSFGLMDFILIPIGILISFFSVFFGFYFFPQMKAWERKGKIESLLPYAIGYISSMASIGVIPYEIFKKLSEAGENYGEVSEEAKQIVRDVELLGFDFMSALRNLAMVTPSTKMRAFIQGAVTTALSGGEMGPYFINTAKEYMKERREIYESLSETLGLLAELYVVGLVAAPLLLVVVLAIMCFIGGASLSIIAAITYLIIPLGSAAFILLIGTLSEK